MRRCPTSLLCLTLLAIAGVAAVSGSASGSGPSRAQTYTERALANAGIARPAARLAKAAAGPSFAADYPGALVVPASPSNFTVANRPVDYPIDMVVIHVAEGTATGTAAEFQRSGAAASANYVVGYDGSVRQMVPEHDIAWHAGNWSINTQAIGIEHEGYTAKGGFTDAEYRGSAGLLGTILDRYAIPPDRTHVIGHNQVPDPNHPGEFGGADHHTDPGRFWAWSEYMALARLDARDTPQASVGLPGGRPAVRKGQTVTYAPVINTGDIYDVFAKTTCGWKPARGARTTASVAIGATKPRSVDVGPKACGRWIWLGSHRLAAGHTRTVRVTVPAHAGAPAIMVVESRDLTPPTLSGTIGVGAITSSTAQVIWTEATDNVGVWGYAVQVGASAVQQVGGAGNLSAVLGSLSCATSQTVAVRAIDLAGNQSAPLTATFATAACPPPPVTVEPPGTLAVVSVTQTTATLGWTVPASGSAPAGYTLTVGAAPGVGTTATEATISGLPCGSTLTAAVSSYDASGNHSAALSTPVTTSSC